MKVSSAQRITINIIKWALFAVVMVVVLVMLTKSTGAANPADIKALQANVTQAADTEKMKEGDNRMLRRLYGIDPELLDGMVLYYPASNMGAEELLFVRVKDPANAAAVKSLIEQRNASQIQAFEGYGVEQTQMLKEAVIQEYGQDIIYAVGEDNKDCIKAYEGT